MKVIVHELRIYEYHELSEEAKEQVKEWYLEDLWEHNTFTETIEEDLKNLFPNSQLNVCYSLSHCQGDGLNVYGTINLDDFLEIDSKTNSNIFGSYTEKEIKRLKFYFGYFDRYTFEKNNRYCYSCKFIDKKYQESTLNEICEDLLCSGIRGIDHRLIDRFLSDMFDWFENYDNKMEQAGYKYFYEVEESEIEEVCASNGWMFLESGEFYE